MPALVRLFIRSIAIGFALAILFLGLVMVFDTAGLRQQILTSGTGYMTAAVLLGLTTVLFSVVQFARALLCRNDDDDNDGNGRGDRFPPSLHHELVPIPVRRDEQRRR
ncbi:hypothetical protein BFP70_00105 [Thioclava sp. SK-1]|uniref:hypothetical protein n=1 Tax=Thioclava sp. SK-1 TaxID=1889770 RepID=UPI000826F1B3|nr:hypothetical protein [Thioclava sp. SK-1]OCX66612.1 hypothetical protein BFP70_00105 [Thioclava sp. SK-1]